MRPRIILVGLLYALAVAFMVASFWEAPQQRVMFERRGWGTSQREKGGAVFVLQVNASGPADGLLRVGDEVVAFESEDVERSDLRLESAYHRVREGEPHRLTVRRDGRPLEVTLRAGKEPAAPSLLTPEAVLGILYSLFFLSVGLAVFLLK